MKKLTDILFAIFLLLLIALEIKILFNPPTINLNIKTSKIVMDKLTVDLLKREVGKVAVYED